MANMLCYFIYGNDSSASMSKIVVENIGIDM